jgi:hypothetical protein
MILDAASDYVFLTRRSFPRPGGSRMGSRTMENTMHRQMGMLYSTHPAARRGRGNSVARSYNRSDALERRPRDVLDVPVRDDRPPDGI